MKRAKDLYPKLISDENLRLAILTVNATHKWHPHHRPNKTVLRVEADIDGYVEKLREIIVNGYDAAPTENSPALGQERRKMEGHIRAEIVARPVCSPCGHSSSGTGADAGNGQVLLRKYKGPGHPLRR